MSYDAAAVSDSVIAHRKAILVATIRQLRDNLTAIIEGQAGAPEILPAAILRPTAGNTKVLSVSGVGAVNTASVNNTWVPDSEERQSAFGFVALLNGQVRVQCEHRASVGTGTSELELYKNNSLVNGWSTGSSSYVQRSIDVNIARGDYLFFRHRPVGAGTESQIKNITVNCANDTFAAA